MSALARYIVDAVVLMIPPTFRPSTISVCLCGRASRGSYDEVAAEDSWTRAMKFFGAQIGRLKSA